MKVQQHAVRVRAGCLRPLDRNAAQLVAAQLDVVGDRDDGPHLVETRAALCPAHRSRLAGKQRPHIVDPRHRRFPLLSERYPTAPSGPKVCDAGGVHSSTTMTTAMTPSTIAPASHRSLDTVTTIAKTTTSPR